LINGTSFTPARRRSSSSRRQRVVDAALTAAAMLFEALGGHGEALDPALQAARPHAGQRRVAERLAALTDGSTLVGATPSPRVRIPTRPLHPADPRPGARRGCRDRRRRSRSS
jgi:histidine ammonia-lyase